MSPLGSVFKGLTVKTAVESRQKVQDFESESVAFEVDHSQMGKATSNAIDYGSKDCAFWPTQTAVFRLTNHLHFFKV